MTPESRRQCQSEPNEGQVMYLCEAHCVTRYADGRADLYVLPVTRVMAHTVKVETSTRAARRSTGRRSR